MAIFIIDDYIEHAKKMEMLVRDILDQRDEDETVLVYTRQDDLLAGMEEQNSLNLFFLDIQMKNVDHAGFLLAQKIRRLEPDALIVFFTTEASYVGISYDYLVEPLSFIDKNSPEAEFIKKVNNCIDVYLKRSQEFIPSDDLVGFESKFNKLYIPLDEILYVETGGSRQIIINTTKGERQISGSISDVADLHLKLIRIHRSIVVNIDKIEKVDRTDRIVKMVDGSVQSVSRTYYNELLKKLEERDSK